jgi:hypothetical protein
MLVTPTRRPGTHWALGTEVFNGSWQRAVNAYRTCGRWLSSLQAVSCVAASCCSKHSIFVAPTQGLLSKLLEQRQELFMLLGLFFLGYQGGGLPPAGHT